MQDKVITRLKADEDAALARLVALLRIPSISTDPAFKDDCARCARHLADDLAAIGFRTELVATTGHEIVLASHHGAGIDKPTVLFYGHYDVQPVDPLDLWHSPPFEPVVRPRADGTREIVARGASDDKGQLMTFVEACRAILAETGALPVNVTLLIEGEEEIGSANLPQFLESRKADLAADIVLVCDTGMWDRRTPAVASMLRGLLGEEVIVRTAGRDLHSGLYGGAVANPLQLLTAALAGLHDAAGRVAIAGFYDGVPEVPAETLDQWAGLGVGESAFLAKVGARVPGGEAGRGTLERIWARPTMEINGITGGYTGEGFKTVLPAEARAKISFRLVGTQDPAVIRAAFRRRMIELLPEGTEVSFLEHGASPGIALDLTGESLKVILGALGDEWQVAPAVIGMGGSIPVVGWFKRLLGLDSFLVGFALDDDNIHAPNEKYDLQSFTRGARSWARILLALGG